PSFSKSTYKLKFFCLAVGVRMLAFPSSVTETYSGTPLTTYFSLSIRISTGTSSTVCTSSFSLGKSIDASFCDLPASMFTKIYRITEKDNDIARTNHLLVNQFLVILFSPPLLRLFIGGLH